MSKPPELGERFNRLSVVDAPPVRKNGRDYARCRCECGALGLFLVKSLRSGNTKSCGCLRREAAVRNGAIGAALTRKPPRLCLRCGKPYRARGRRGFCSLACSHAAQRGVGTGYVKRGGRHEHRVVAEQTLGRPLRRGEIVHHKDGNKHNNAPENLAVMTQSEHMREHGLGIPGQPLPWRPWEKRKRRRAS